MAKIDDLENKVDMLEKQMDSRFEKAALENKVMVIQEIAPLKQFKSYLAGAAAIAVVVFGIGGFWIKSTFSEMSEIADNVKAISGVVVRLQKELETLDSNLSDRFQRIEHSVAGITATVGQSEVGSITTPNGNANVGAEFEARGTVTLEPNQVAWLATRIGGLYWPKEPAIESTGPWVRQVFEGGAPGRKLLVLLVVEESTNAEISQWFATGHQTGRFPGMRLDRRAIVVAEIGFTLR